MTLTKTNKGYYGNFGGAYIPELLQANVQELAENYERIATMVRAEQRGDLATA